ncbi:MAG: hypothetical protein J1G05_01655 [Clostridiales bacterium]|nr:hypothetical protein [Clostridiales bacterium]
MIKIQNINVTESDIVSSLTPLMEEYFCGKIAAEENKIIFTSESGQTFQITVTQI